jgi:hypothetical protein
MMSASMPAANRPFFDQPVVFPGRVAGALEAVRDEDHAANALAAQRLFHQHGVNVHAIGDDLGGQPILDVDEVRDSRGVDPFIDLHRHREQVVQVGDQAQAGVDRRPQLRDGRVAVRHAGHHAVLDAPLDEGDGALDLRGDVPHPDPPA